MTFAPSVERARAEGVRVRREEYPSGVAGVKMSLEAIAQHIREGAADKEVQGWAMDQLLAAGINGRGGTDTSRRKMSVLLEAVRKNTVYTADPPGTEMVKSAAAMLCLRPNLCIRGGDCFPEGTLLLRDNWREVPIEHIEPGQKIWGWNGWTTVVQVWSKGVLPVDALFLESRYQPNPEPGHEVARSSTLELTGDHHVFSHWNEKVRLRVRELKEGDALLRPSFVFWKGDDGLARRATRCFESPLFIRKIERAVRKVPCWDISTSDHYVYLPEHDVTVSNCDDVVILLGSLLLSVGIPVMVVKQTFSAADQEHVLIEAQDDNGRWIPLDPSTNAPAGTKAWATEEFRMDPTDPSMIGLTGAPEAQFISIGATPGFPVFVGKIQRRLAPRIVKRQTRRMMRPLGATTTSISTATSSSVATAINPYGQALTDLQNQVQTPIKAGDVYLGNKDYAGALTAYQAAGQVGATNVGPEIDLVGAAAYTQPWTQKAWVANGTLAGLGPVQNTDPNAKTIATQAQTLVKGMLANYVSAIQAGQTAFNQGNPGPVPNPPWAVNQFLPWMLGVGVVAGLGFAYVEAHAAHPIQLTRRKRRRR